MTAKPKISLISARLPTSYRDGPQSFRCPITGRPCEGDLSYVCEDYGCARKGGLSPHSDENF